MDRLQDIFQKTIASIYNVDKEVIFTRTDNDFGDFSTNVAMLLAKELKDNPRQIAQNIVDSIDEAKGIRNIEVAGPGFINLRVSDEILVDMILVPKSDENTQTVVIETNNPNPFKSMHIGHGFNCVLADTIANLLESSGANTHRVSYHGDVGLHVGKSMYSLLKFVEGDPSKLDTIPVNERNRFMSQMYAQGSKAYKNDDSAKKEIDGLAKQSFILDDPIYKKVYETCREWSFEQIDDLVARLGNKPTERRYLESQADNLGVETVRQHVGDVFIESEGAIMFPGSKYGSFDNVFVGSNGSGLYGARDLGLMQLKNRDYHPEKSYIVTAEEQRDYFKGVIKASELCLPNLQNTTVNIPTGTVKLTSGKMSSRDGDVLEVEWLFNQIKQALESHSSNDEAIITGAIRYQFLKVKIGNDVVFDIQGATQLQGNTGPYLQYSYARAYSILSKINEPTDTMLIDLESNEHILLHKISEYNEILEKAQKDLSPHILANYTYELTQSFNSFYEKNRVIGDEREDQRVKLIGLYTRTLKKCLDILGIPVLEKM